MQRDRIIINRQSLDTYLTTALLFLPQRHPSLREKACLYARAYCQAGNEDRESESFILDADTAMEA